MQKKKRTQFSFYASTIASTFLASATLFNSQSLGPGPARSGTRLFPFALASVILAGQQKLDFCLDLLTAAAAAAAQNGGELCGRIYKDRIQGGPGCSLRFSFGNAPMMCFCYSIIFFFDEVNGGGLSIRLLRLGIEENEAKMCV